MAKDDRANSAEVRDLEDSKAHDDSKVTVSDTLLGTDPPIEDAHPGLQPALVFASYPIALILLISIIAVYFLFIRSNPKGEIGEPVRVESTN